MKRNRDKSARPEETQRERAPRDEREDSGSSNPTESEPRAEDTGLYEAGPLSEASQRLANRDVRPTGNRGTVREPEPLSVDADPDDLARRALEEATGER